RKMVEAEPFLRYVVSVRPETIDARRGLATIYYDRGAMSKALAHLEKWVELDGGDGQARRFMGVIYKDMGANAPAAEHYRAALGPPSPRGLRGRARLRTDAEEFAAAASLLEQALRQDAHDCPCRYQLAQAYEHLGRRSAAAEQLRRLDQSQRLFKELSELNQ